jgi:hypothetical protein
MRQLVLLLVTLFLFVASFGAIYISFRTSAPQIRALVGGGFFLLISSLLLWKDFTSAAARKII